MQEFFKLTLNKDGQKYTEFEDKVKTLVEKIAKSLDDAPEWEEDWKIEAVNSFTKQLYVKPGTTSIKIPKFST